MSKKYYAVRNGRNVGIYNTWDECKSQVNGYSGCSFKSFSSKSEAQAFMNSSSSSNSGYSSNNRSSYSSYKPKSSYNSSYNRNSYSKSKSSSNYNSNSYSGNNYSYSRYAPSYSSNNSYSNSSNNEKATAYVDGSYNKYTGEYGSGTVIFHGSNEHQFRKKNNDPKYSSMRNVAGELGAAKIAMDYCVDNNISKLDLHYDYSGIEDWAKGNWKTNKTGTKEYKKYYNSIKDKVDVNFIKVKAHSNNKYNDKADKLAKSAVGNI